VSSRRGVRSCADPRSASLGYPPQSILESLWQQDAYLWHPEYGHMAINDIKLDDGNGQYKRMKELAMVSLSCVRDRWLTLLQDLLYYEPVMRMS
jgi:hypothetical protein